MWIFEFPLTYPFWWVFMNWMINQYPNDINTIVWKNVFFDGAISFLAVDTVADTAFTASCSTRL